MYRAVSVALALFGSMHLRAQSTLQSIKPGSAGPTQTESKPAPAPLPNPNAQGIYHLHSPLPGLLPPRLVHQVEPAFPMIARQRGLGGSAVVALIVDKEGTPTKVHIVHSAAEALGKDNSDLAPAFDEAAVKAVQQYRFTPGTFNGKPVSVEVNINVTFEFHP